MESGQPRSRRKAALILALMAPLLLCHCGSVANLKAKLAAKLKNKANAKAAAEAKNVPSGPVAGEMVGEISYVDEESGFVLVRQAVGKKISPNTPLVASGQAGASLLLSSPAAKSSFVAADIVKGNPQKGDTVTVDSAKASGAPPTPKETTSQENLAAGKPTEGASGTGAKVDPILPPLMRPADEPDLPAAAPSLPLPQ